jgi:hypothetical protein
LPRVDEFLALLFLEILSGDTVALGVTAADHPTDKLPGLAPGSIGYHSSGGLVPFDIALLDKSCSHLIMVNSAAS